VPCTSSKKSLHFQSILIHNQSDDDHLRRFGTWLYDSLPADATEPKLIVGIAQWLSAIGHACQTCTVERPHFGGHIERLIGTVMGAPNLPTCHGQKVQEKAPRS
jgi:hypothetical protein